MSEIISVRAVMIHNLVQNGMFEEQANKVMENVESHSEDLKGTWALDSMHDNWNKDAFGYPHMILQLAWRHVQRMAVKWTEDNAPEAWFLPVLKEKSPVLLPAN
ncbi:hypothetical protein [Vibrio owensii]|uniref:hypothetical protein n=1 Tax=Vibrio harveyi group TaxID=717610 RepID=UPI003CC5DB2B